MLIGFRLVLGKPMVCQIYVSGTPTGAPIGQATLAPVPLGVQVPVAAEVKHGFGGFQKGFLC